MIRYGIPEYRLPKQVLDDEIEIYGRVWVSIKTNTPPVKNVKKLLKKQGYRRALLSQQVHGQRHKVGVPWEGPRGSCIRSTF